MAEVTMEGRTGGYVAEPPAGTGPAVLVLHEWWGLDDHMRSVCDRLAEAGFLALAPDLYRGEVTDQPEKAGELMSSLPIDRAEGDMRAAVDHLAQHPSREGEGVAAVGFSLGGGLALRAATNEQVAVAVDYYHVLPHGPPDVSAISASILGHFGTADELSPAEDAGALEEELRARGVDVTIELYDGKGHAFFNDSGETYDREAAELSWQRTVDFVGKLREL